MPVPDRVVGDVQVPGDGRDVRVAVWRVGMERGVESK